MTSVLKTNLCRLLIVLMAWTPFQFASAAVISTDQAIGAAAERAAVFSVLQRSDVSNQLQALGVDPSATRDRVASLTDEEVRSLNDKLQALPAGGSSGWAIAAVILIVALIWYFAVK